MSLLRDFVTHYERRRPWPQKRLGALTLLVYVALLAVSVWLIVR